MCRWFDSAPGHQYPCAPAPFSGPGAFLQLRRIFYKNLQVAVGNLLVQQFGAARGLATLRISKHDGSLILSLVRAGRSASGWRWSPNCAAMEAVDFESPVPKTKKVTIHTSGAVNVHDVATPGRTFIPCLLDLTEPVLVIGYVVPSISALDIAQVTNGDHIIFFPSPICNKIAFEFYAIPADAPTLPGESWRFVVEGRYGLACTVAFGSAVAVPTGTPDEAFTTYRVPSLIPAQAIREDQVFIRFQQLMHSNQVSEALNKSAIPKELHAKIIQSSVESGRGIQGPNPDGVWEIVCNVQMHRKPELTVVFRDPRFKAELVDLKPSDNRLEKVRVRFKVLDLTSNSYVKTTVEVLSISLNAELLS